MLGTIICIQNGLKPQTDMNQPFQLESRARRRGVLYVVEDKPACMHMGLMNVAMIHADGPISEDDYDETIHVPEPLAPLDHHQVNLFLFRVEAIKFMTIFTFLINFQPFSPVTMCSVMY